jgi:hypothetical protein
LTLPETILRLLLGCIVLLAGRNVFWLFVGIIGFLVGASLAETWIGPRPFFIVVAVAIGCGILGAVLAVVYERVAFALAGFLAMVYFLLALSVEFGIGPVPAELVIVGGLLGALLAALVMDWAIIVLSSLAGATLVVSTFAASPVLDAAVLAMLTAIGIVVQYSILAGRRRGTMQR